MNPRTILIIDNDSQVAQDITAEVSRFGYQTICCATAQEGKELAISAHPDLCIICVELPDQNGFVLCSMLKRNPDTANLPIFIMSKAQTTDDFKRHLNLSTHADGYFQKPLAMDDLIQNIENQFAYLDQMAEYAAAQAAMEAEAQEYAEDYQDQQIPLDPDAQQLPPQEAPAAPADQIDPQMQPQPDNQFAQPADNYNAAPSSNPSDVKPLEIDNVDIFSGIDPNDIDDEEIDGLSFEIDDNIGSEEPGDNVDIEIQTDSINPMVQSNPEDLHISVDSEALVLDDMNHAEPEQTEESAQEPAAAAQPAPIPQPPAQPAPIPQPPAQPAPIPQPPAQPAPIPQPVPIPQPSVASIPPIRPAIPRAGSPLSHPNPIPSIASRIPAPIPPKKPAATEQNNEEITRLNNEIAQLKSSLDDLKNQCAQKDALIAELQTRYDELNTFYQSSQADAESVRTQLDQAQNDITQLSQTNETLNAQIQDLLAAANNNISDNVSEQPQPSKDADIARNNQIKDIIEKLSALIVEV